MFCFKGRALHKKMKVMKRIKIIGNQLLSAILFYSLSKSANAAAIKIPFLDDIWDTFTQIGLPILFGLGILGAFIADRHDSETGKRVLMSIAVSAIVLKVAIAFLAFARTSFSSGI
ncbi:MAG: hypothetical protein RLZZ210_1404 [Pseudomonadota bacterium]|jgi:hypothetical protein